MTKASGLIKNFITNKGLAKFNSLRFFQSYDVMSLGALNEKSHGRTKAESLLERAIVCLHDHENKTIDSEFIEINHSAFDNKINFYCLESDKESDMNAVIIFAVAGGRIVGRMMMGNAPTHEHLIVLNVDKKELKDAGITISEREISSEMIKTYIDGRGLNDKVKEEILERPLHISCVGGGAGYIEEVNKSLSGLTKESLKVRDLYNSACSATIDPMFGVSLGKPATERLM